MLNSTQGKQKKNESGLLGGIEQQKLIRTKPSVKSFSKNFKLLAKENPANSVQIYSKARKILTEEI